MPGLGSFTQSGSWANEEIAPADERLLASGQPPGADPPWCSGQLSAVCQFLCANSDAGASLHCIQAPSENLTGERLDVASVEMLRAFSDIGLRCFAEQCRHWQPMVEFELERRKST